MKTFQRALEQKLEHNGGSIGGGECPIDDHTSGAIRAPGRHKGKMEAAAGEYGDRCDGEFKRCCGWGGDTLDRKFMESGIGTLRMSERLETLPS